MSRIDFPPEWCKIAPMDEWDQYRLILAIHRAGTIRGAANHLGVNHATVSRRLAQVSSRFESPVFDKVTGGYKASDLGLELVAAAEDMELIALAADRKSRALGANLSGPIRVSMGEPIAQYLLQDELIQFTHMHPNIQLTLETSIDFVDLNRSEADVVIRSTPNPPEHLVGRRLFPFYLCEYASKEYLAKTRVEDRKWLTFSKSQTVANWIVNSSHPEASIGFSSNDLVWLLAAAKAGEGMIRTACYLADPDPSLQRLPGAKPTQAQDLWVLTHPDLKNAPRVQHLMRHLARAIEDKRNLIQGRL